MTKVIVIDGGKLLSGALLPVLLILKHANSMAYPFRGVKYLVLEVISLNVCEESVNLS